MIIMFSSRPVAVSVALTVVVAYCMTKITIASHVTSVVCSFETPQDLCGWEDAVSVHEGVTGLTSGADSNLPFPQTDTNPGNKNGSYFYYKRPQDFLSSVYILQYPRQQYITSISFSYYISGLILLSVVQTGIHSTDIVTGGNWSSNQTETWEQASVRVNETDPKYGIAIVSPSMGAELGEAEVEVDPILAIDNLTVEFTLPCDFDHLADAGNFILSVPNALDIPLGHETVVQFTASSTVCPEGPFVYTIEKNDHPELSGIFSIDESTGALTVDGASGSHLITEGIEQGKLTISVQVKDSDYLGTGNIVKRHSILVYQQDPTITIGSPTSISVEAFIAFTYLIKATSHLGSNLMYSNLQTSPSSLHSNMSVDGMSVSGVITHSGLVDIIKLGKIPSFTIDISDEYGGILSWTVQLLLPSIPPTFNKDHYVFHIEEGTHAEVIGNLTVGDVNENNCADVTVSLSSNDSEALHYFSLISYGEISGTESLCEFLLFSSNSLDYETKAQYELLVTANDTDGQSVVTRVTVKVESVNEDSPQFTNSGLIKITTDYMSFVNKLIYELEATDTDTGPAGQLHYSIASGNTAGNFKLNQTSNNRVDILSKSAGLLPGNYPLQVTVTDSQYPYKSDTVLVIIVVSEGTIDCSNDLFGPPELTEASTTLFSEPVNSDATIYCNHTSFPPAYPTQWTSTKFEDSAITTTLISESDHYSIEESKLIIHGLTPEDSRLYSCNVTSPCGSAVSTPVFIQVIEPPESVIDLRIADGPYKDSVLLTWTPPGSSSTYPIDGYIVSLKQGVNIEYMIYQKLSYHEPNNELPLSETVLTGLKPGTNYTVKVLTYNLAGKRESNELSLKTIVSAPKLSYFEAISLSNHSIRIEWVLEYTGGSDNIHMMVEVESHEVKRPKRSTLSPPPVSMEFEVGVNENVLVTPSLPYGRSYQVSSHIGNEFGSTSHMVTAFIGVQDTVHCSFSKTSSCRWKLVSGRLQTGSSHTKEEPNTDAKGLSSGAYVINLVDAPDSITEVLSYPSTSYLCGYSFYYQLNEEVRLLLQSSSSGANESLYWASPVKDILKWQHEEVPAGDIPISLVEEELVFVMEAFEEPSVVSFVAIDEVSLFFCLPCNYSQLTNDSILVSSPMNLTIYMRSKQRFKIEAELKNCTNPLLNFKIKGIIPSHLRAKVLIPDPREGVIILSDITPDMASVGTEGTIQVIVEVANADYKNNGLVLSKTVVVPFVVLEKFENCSDVRNCSFDNGACDWRLSEQSDSDIIADNSGNFFLRTRPFSANSNAILKIADTEINDSYCGVSFLYKTHKSDIQISVEGLGVIWSTAVEEEFDPRVNTSSVWQGASLYIDVLGVERRESRKLFIELLLSDLSGNAEAMALFDNITLHPCVDCQAKECSCISCIQQCGTDPCQTGYYLSLEVNQCRPCPAGYYCSDWRSLPIPCPPGTFNNKTGAWSKDNCQICPNGTYSLKTAAISCEDCPSDHTCLEKGKLPLPNAPASEQSYLGVIIGIVVGVVSLSCILATLGTFCYCRSKYKKSIKRKQEKAMYKDNFMRGLDDDSRYCSRGPKSGTVRTVSTIMSSRNEDIAIGTIDKKPFYDSLDSSDDEDAEKQRNLFHAEKFTNSGTVSSLKSLESSKDWRDNNPFPTSESSSDMSVLIELHDEKDHVWSALKKKKKKKVLDDESNSLF